MNQFLPTLCALTIAPFIAQPAIAGTCVANSSCGSQPIQFVPGSQISVEIANLSRSFVDIQQIGMMEPLALPPDQQVSLLRGGTKNPNFSAMFWEREGGKLIVNISQPTEKVLRIEIRSGGQIEGNSAVYVRDDGRVEVF
ncbi:hypothetical protein IQ249_18320 [Lusitaniella coriacea LEGE 07157]|uniref:AMIN domain-containing protein n=1 Tax=Lusitaniella coriacea LEGE 07157 TaxID=945747 RepID=A0A8J7J581_9CYAN|nr:hypothetical protein [Lusitaniella coriacea]MBE9117859.1 hypothetical protein [Lusitaniella coriacea LEGE 07157]